MRSQFWYTTLATLIMALSMTSNATLAGEFDEVSVSFEQNATDGDVEVVFEIKGDEEGLETLLVIAPNGRVVINATFTAGMREFVFESPEPPDNVALIQENYPEGIYNFYATTASGDFLHATDSLSHTLPQIASFLSPGEEAIEVPLNQSISWSPVAGAVGYIVEVENDDLDTGTTIQVAASTTTIELPAGLLQPGTVYDLEIGAISADGNRAFIETSFVTAGQPPAAAYNPIIDPANFVATIDNHYFPLVPGTIYTYRAETEEGTEEIKVSVTHETKNILGVTCVVVRDTVTVDGELVEDTYDWYAQDRDGNVWYMGEDSKEYEDGEMVSTAGSWEAGVDGAKPGVIWQANPQVGDIYRQEYYASEAEDMAEVVSLNESVIVPYSSYSNTIQTKEWTPLEPDTLEYKYYAPNVGVVLEVNPETGERVELVDISVQ